MFANSMTIYTHPEELIAFIGALYARGVTVLNSAVFNGGFLLGSDFYNYTLVRPDSPENIALFQWRADFYAVCAAFKVDPAAACVHFGLHIPGVTSIALSSSSSKRTADNIRLADAIIPDDFWAALKSKKLISAHYPF
jgi:D-threo-aldose 1-dehydrogenase